MSLESIKEKADLLIGKKVSVFTFNSQGQLTKEEFTIKNNKIDNKLNMCLSYFEEGSVIVNSITILDSKLFEIIPQEDTKEEVKEEVKEDIKEKEET
jgi:hypothetical protein